MPQQQQLQAASDHEGQSISPVAVQRESLGLRAWYIELLRAHALAIGALVLSSSDDQDLLNAMAEELEKGA